MQQNEVNKLKEWFLSQRRDLPWRENPSPYAVWVSEVMLQQTQVAVVIPYFQRWMERFPTIESLAQASVEEVVKEWEGLGYYSRARNLHEGAQYVVKHYSGVLPAVESQLKEIKGLGTYTVGAILSFAFHQKAAAVDGNVIRVLARYYCLNEDVCKAKTQKKIQEWAHDLLPNNEPWIISEALIELGATVCIKNPKCTTCPLSANCKAFLQGKAQELPLKSLKQPTVALFRGVTVIISDGYVLLRCGGKGKIMADLFEFPYFEMDSLQVDMELHKKWMKEELKLSAKWQQALPQVKHSFTRYRAVLVPHLFESASRKDVPGFTWHSFDSVKKLPFSSGHRRILGNVILR